ncbi:lysozyme inhibitor LprI family protein [Afipia sp. DC4300-2b1]|uniref:lysozyme inhibitor LprI family protein n=1 Tax=Afipia sp. DC4300-2b1 TaxID=2804672 RepID=UPI003CF6B829
MNFSRSIIGVLAMLLVFGAALSSANAADYSPLDCKKASSAAERTICSDYGLGQSEARVATLYGLTTSLVAMGQRGTIQDDQRAFLRQRDACGANAGCLRAAYAARDKQLEAVMQSIQQRGPF